MKFIKRNTKAINEAKSRASGLLNSRIIKFQNRLAMRLNAWINRFSLRSQKRILWIFIVLSFCGISAKVLLSVSRPAYYSVAAPAGLPAIHLPSTGSLTNKK